MISPPKTPEPPLYVESETGLRRLFREVKKAPSIALDTEAASFHKYKDRIYLLQLSTPAVTAVIDPLAVTDLSGLGKILADPGVEVVFHDADYDLRLLDRDYGFRVSNIFDTRIAAQLLNEPGVGLGALLEKYVGVKPDKRFQRADWSARPLTEAMLDYAATDTRHLLDVRDILREQLRERNRLTWAEEEFRSLESIRWTRPSADPDRFWRLKGAKALRGRSLAVLRELYEWRERVAKRADRAPFRIMHNESLITLAKEQPRTLEALQKIRGVGTETVSRRGKDIIAAIQKGLETAEADYPKLERVRRKPPDPALIARLDRLKTLRNRKAASLELPSGVLCPNGTLEAIAKSQPRNLEELVALPEVTKWQVEVMGEEMIAVVNGTETGKREEGRGN